MTVRGVSGVEGGDGDPHPVALEPFPVEYAGYTYKGWIAYSRDGKPAPQVLVIPNYAGLKQFDRDQAVFLARCGFVGIAVDVYGEPEGYGEDDRSPAFGSARDVQLRHMRGAFRQVNVFMRDPALLRSMLGAYLAAGRRHPAVDARFAAAIGYCFGGTAVLEMVRGGLDVQAVVSFHGVLQSRPGKFPFLPGESLAITAPVNAYATRCKVLVENGDLDEMVTERSYREFRKEFNEAGVDWRFDNHANTPHGFALAPGCFNNRYTEAADRRSTLAMLSLFAEVFPHVRQRPVACNACGTALGQSVSLLESRL